MKQWSTLDGSTNETKWELGFRSEMHLFSFADLKVRTIDVSHDILFLAHRWASQDVQSFKNKWWQ